MLSQCANRECTNRFRFLHEGRVFVLDCNPKPASAKIGEGGRQPERRIETFWLCAECAQSWTVRFDGTRVVTMRLPDPPTSQVRPSQNAA
jgi:hypothetical protein